MSKKIDRTGEVGYNNDGEKMMIVKYSNANDIDVKFEDGTIIKHNAYNNFKKGNIKNPMRPSVYGVGFIGVGDYKTCDENGKETKCHKVWRSMLERCYSSKFHEREQTYRGCTVCEEWWNFQVFAEWFYEHYYEIENETMNLDKDILKKGNKIYSADTCIFTPQFINSLFVKSNKIRSKYYIGVTKHGDKFKAYLNKYNKLIHLGMFTTPEEAFQAYKKAKEQYIKETAERYKLLIPHELYQALMNYKVEIDD